MFHVKVPDIHMNLLEPKNHLGRGSFGQVIRALYRGKPVAMKVLENDSDQCRKQFLNEMERLYTLRHPNIIEVMGKCSCNTKLAFVMELMDNGSLEDTMHRHLRIVYKADHVISWAKQCADAVSFLHDRGLVHRDLKPNNLLLKDNFRRLKLCDFGTVSNVKSTMTNNRGSPSTMAPEVFKGQKYNDKCDVYSFGITLWEMITRKRPFKSDATAFTILWRACEGHRPPVISEPCPAILMEIITDCWHEDPEARPSMKNVLEILTELTKIYPDSLDPLNFPDEGRSGGDIPSSSVIDYDSRFDLLDAELTPIPSQNVPQENERDLYADQVAACREVCDAEVKLKKLYKLKHELIARLSFMAETVKLLEKRDSLRTTLLNSHSRIFGSKQLPPKPFG